MRGMRVDNGDELFGGILPGVNTMGTQEEEQEKKKMQEENWKKVKKGWLAVRVGLEGENGGGFRRFTIPISYLHHPHFRRLLEAAQEAYGYRSPGPLRLPCSVDDFLHLRWLIERETHSSHHHRHHYHHHHRISSLSLHSDA
ncbi:hypothetical protein Taro_007072 [Colocasia esculenta]|uniref:Uncharacterized protein n=1 Tax=Colocasia esculenta TaxID=4460 RepID=A0A843TX47_COLES|nr:hypothetical protein [Colocasia esculenta]